jgi:hypothetical protein
MIRKARPHVTQDEPLLFELSSPGKRAYQLPKLDVPEAEAAAVLGAGNVRAEIEGFPEVSEVEAIRHFTRLSTWNYAIDHGLYPLGSCTMKYNPRINEQAARVEGLAWAHPYQPESLSQGAMEIMAMLESALAEITGMAAVTLQPAAGAHGELTGILLVRALLEARGNARKKILIPDSAHGTNPATAAIAGYAVENIKSNDRGMLDVEALARLVDEDVAALMVTNPNTLGIFEQDIVRVAGILHAKGAQLYMEPAQDLLDAARRRRSRKRTGRGGQAPGAVPSGSAPGQAERALDVRLPPATVSRPRQGLLRELRGAGAGAGLHHGARRRRPLEGHHGRGAQRELHSQEARAFLRPPKRRAHYARVRLQR